MNTWIILLLTMPLYGAAVLEVDIKAFTLGESFLSSETPPSPEISLSFTDEFDSSEIPENATELEINKTLGVDNEADTNRTDSINFGEMKPCTADPAAISDVFPHTFFTPWVLIVTVTASVIFMCYFFKVFRRRNQRICRTGLNNPIHLGTTVLDQDDFKVTTIIPSDNNDPSSVTSCSTRTTMLSISDVSDDRTKEEMTTEL